VAPRERTPPERADRPVRLVSTMRVARRKRPVQLVRMFETLTRQVQRPLSLTIIGDGPQRPKLERLLVMRNLQDMVTVTGRVHPAEVFRLLAEADVYVAPAVLESFGLAALEARCVGLPVVGRAASGMADFIRQGVDGMLCDSDAHMVATLRELATDDDLRTRISEHNRTVPSAFTWPNAMQHHDATYAFACGPAHSLSRRSLRPALEQ
jgi:glycosyltransferase involved in cell wall biosynthesis